MIRDYKFQRTEWKLRKKRKVDRRPLIWILAGLALLGATWGIYGLLDQENIHPTETPQENEKNPNVIPLQLPPNRQAPISAG